jgi:uncharacterized membrane protein
MCGTKITKVPHHQQRATSGLLRSASRAPAGRRTRSGMHTHDFPGGKERWEPHFHCRRYVVRVSSMRWLLLARHCYERGLHGRSGRSLDSVGSVSSEMGEHSLEKHSLGSAFCFIIYYVRRDALHYLFHHTPDSFKAFWSERILIRTHVACAVTMIFVGPLQFWTGLRMRSMTLHVWSGRVFLVTGTFVGCSALYMGLHPRTGGIVFGFGLFLNGLFYLAAASIAYYAIRLGNVQVHQRVDDSYLCSGMRRDRRRQNYPRHDVHRSANWSRRLKRYKRVGELGGAADGHRDRLATSPPPQDTPPD